MSPVPSNRRASITHPVVPRNEDDEDAKRDEERGAVPRPLSGYSERRPEIKKEDRQRNGRIGFCDDGKPGQGAR